MKLSVFIIICVLFSFNAKTQGLKRSDYQKKEVYIKMRDGVKLYAAIYAPKDESKEYPVIMWRTPYSCKPYGSDTLPAKIMHNPDLVASGYIFIKQDMRGRWMSEGKFENTKPPYSWSIKMQLTRSQTLLTPSNGLRKILKILTGI